jgi:hypothetical protein
VNKKGISTLVIVAIIVIAVVIGGIAVYVWYSGGGEEEPTPTPTPTPDIEGATSMRFDVNATVDGALEVDRFTAKNLGTSDVLLRVDQTDAQGNEFIYLMNQTGQTVWADFGTGFLDQSENFADQYWNNELIGGVALDSYMTALADWSGTGDYEGDSFIIYNIVVDPTIPDSAFQPTS